MNHRPPTALGLRSSLACLSACLVALVAAGCLPDDPAVKGRLLQAGREVERPAFVVLDGEPWVMYQTRVARGARNRGPVSDLHLVNWADPSKRRLFLANRVERGEWPVAEDANGARFYMTEERIAPNGLPIGTLLRISLTEGLKETLPDVMSYALGASRKTFYYRKYVEGSPFPELHLRDLEGRDRNLGPLSGQMLLIGDDLIYYITGEDRILMRVQGFDGPAVALRAKVSRFQLSGTQKFAIATVAENGALKTVVIDFMTKTERPLPVDNPCCWLDLRGTTFVFAQSYRSPAEPAELHYFDVATGADRVVKMPPQMSDVVAIVARPPTGKDAIIFDSQRRVAVYRPNADPPVEMTGLRPTDPQFSPDGKYLLFLVPEPPPPPPAVSSVVTGVLYAQDAEDWSKPPRQLSPPGASVPVSPKGYIIRDGRPFPLVFWARFGLGASDLYLGDHETGEHLKVAQGIGEVSVSQTHVLGVMHMSQDLTGDLVFRDFACNRQVVVEHGVSEVEFFEDSVAFIVRERMDTSHRNGLWATTLPKLQESSADCSTEMQGLTNWLNVDGAGEAPSGIEPPESR